MTNDQFHEPVDFFAPRPLHVNLGLFPFTFYLFITIFFYWTAFTFHLVIYQFINTSGFQLA